MSTVAERSMRSLLAVEEPIVACLRGFEDDWFLYYPIRLDRAHIIAERLRSKRKSANQVECWQNRAQCAVVHSQQKRNKRIVTTEIMPHWPYLWFTPSASTPTVGLAFGTRILEWLFVINFPFCWLQQRLVISPERVTEVRNFSRIVEFLPLFRRCLNIEERNQEILNWMIT